MTAILRFAPSPNGRLHLGHAYSAWLNARLAKKLAGKLLLRMEDIDINRCSEQFAQQCLDDLAWLGLTWEQPIRVQSQHFSDYTAALDVLKSCGVVYRCFCTRRQIADASSASDPDGAPIYPRTCHDLSEAEVKTRIAAEEAYAWRLDMPAALAKASAPLTYIKFDADTLAENTVLADPARWGDVLLVRKEIPTSYHLSVVVDDALQGITHVVRGQDLEAATDLHVLLQAIMGLGTPRYHHHGLLSGDDGKLSKRTGSESLADLRLSGVTAEEVRRIIAEMHLFSV
ncbi:MAG: tRNA glutamyl-Q(34) synthetase GluQRS, partial [Alphaproteobacteria bacterium]|nr:tRNA glutamyl-Q(34) synthetase GluQRS [Alphaproteobacteria bacterium]